MEYKKERDCVMNISNLYGMEKNKCNLTNVISIPTTYFLLKGIESFTFW